MFSRARVPVLALGLAVVVAAVACMVLSFRAGWDDYVPYWGAPIQPVPANDTATGWSIAAMGAWLVGGTLVVCAVIPRRRMPAAVLAAGIVAGAFLGLTAIMAIA